MKRPQVNPKELLINNLVPILFIVICIIGIPLSGYSGTYLLNEILSRLGRNSFLVLSLLIPVMAGMGLNFGMTLGAMAGQIGLIFVSDWSIVGVYQLFVLYFMGSIIPIKSSALVLPRGYGIRNTVNLESMRKSLDNLIPFNIFGASVPLATFILVALFCLFIVWFRRTKLGQDMRAVGQDMEVARQAGIKVERTRVLSIILSTVFAGFGMIIYLQNIGTLNTYNSHSQIGMFSIAALLVGGASVDKANIRNVFIGIILFHLMFTIAPTVGRNLIGEAQLGEYFRVFVSYGVITLALVLYEMRKRRAERIALERGEEVVA